MTSNRRLRVFAALIAAAMSVLAVAAVSAQTAPGGAPNVVAPPPITTPLPPPTPLDLGPGIRLGFLAYPFDFHFAGPVYGFGFKPGERVTIAVRNVSASPVTVIADSSGSFVAQLGFTWIFCGSHAAQQAAPVLLATGNQGTTAQASLQPVACPMLVSNQHLAAALSVGSGSGIAPAATAIAGTAVVLTVQPGAPLPGPLSPPTPLPAAPPQLETFDIQGFGFAPGEHVTVRELFGTGSSPELSLSTVHTTADAQGRLTFTIQAHVPGHCSSMPLPMLAASGDQGTAVTSPIRWTDPIMTPCMAPPGALPPAGTPPPPGVPIPVVTPAPPGPSPSSSLPDGNGAGLLAISLHPSVARPGGMERASVQAAGSRTVHLVVRYPGNRSTNRTAAVDAQGRVTLRWRVPASARPGTAHGELTVAPGNVSLQISFIVR